VVQKDIQAHLERATAPAEHLPLSGVRRATVQRLAAAGETIPVPLFIDVEMRAARKLRKLTRAAYIEATGVACSVNAVILRACGVALAGHPALNGQWTEDGVRLSSSVNIAVAVQVEVGLLAPIVPEVERKSLLQLHGELLTLVEAARARRLAPAQLRGGSFTVSNLGSAGIRAFVPVINPPQVAILGVGEIAKRVVVVKGKPKARWMATLCLVFDHRAVDGLPAARFLRRVKELLENPYLLV
jgi:pyruvate dehydrogenase E2 component (dihydrolipoamide acetyltransferase)